MSKRDKVRNRKLRHAVMCATSDMASGESSGAPVVRRRLLKRFKQRYGFKPRPDAVWVGPIAKLFNYDCFTGIAMTLTHTPRHS